MIMTRQIILSLYTVDDQGIIRNPGKFELGPIYSPYFYNLVLHGEGELIVDDEFPDGDDVFFRITKEEKQEFPELNNYDIVCVTESEKGFVYSYAFTQKDFNEL